jgi:hypothetical protein
LASVDANDGESTRISELKLPRIVEKMALYVFMIVLAIALRGIRIRRGFLDFFSIPSRKADLISDARCVPELCCPLRRTPFYLDRQFS